MCSFRCWITIQVTQGECIIRGPLSRDLSDVGGWSRECLERGQPNRSEQEAQRRQDGEALHELTELTEADVAETDQGGAREKRLAGVARG